VAEALFVGLGSAGVAAIGVRRGDRLTARKVLALVVLTLGVVVLQAGVSDA
jgi:multidrug transporter EmrE-like cation transporter